MPRQQLNTPETPASPVVSLHWGRDTSTVQLSMSVPVTWLREIAAREDLHTRDGRVSLYSENLDRSTLNRSVTALRRARDTAYGKDA